MSDGKSFILQVLVELIGCVMIGVFQNVIRRGTTFYYIFPFLCFGAYSTAYRVSGAHLNPVISIISTLRSDMPQGYKRLWPLAYIPAQVIGFIGGCFICWWIFEEPGELNIAKKANADDSWWYSEAICGETFASLAFVLIYLNQTSHITWTSIEPGLQCFLISTAYAALVILTKFQSGGSLNPAYAFAQNLTDAFKDAGESDFKHIWIYVLFPLIGGALALGIHEGVAIPGNKEAKTAGSVYAKAADQ
jgi:glycerol uptake facilitator-like aquaporin